MFNVTKSPLSKTMIVLHLIRDNSLNILAFSAILTVVFHPLAALFQALFITYFIFCQFRRLPFHKFLRKWGYDALFLQYFNPCICDTNTGRELFFNRLLYRRDYILLGYGEFSMYCNELIHLDRDFEKLNLDVDAYENCYN